MDCETGVIGCGCWSGTLTGRTTGGFCGTIVDVEDGECTREASCCEGSAIGSGKTGLGTAYAVGGVLFKRRAAVFVR